MQGFAVVSEDKTPLSFSQAFSILMNVSHCLLNNTHRENEKSAFEEESAVYAKLSFSEKCVYWKTVFMAVQEMLYIQSQRDASKQFTHGYSYTVSFHQSVMLSAFQEVSFFLKCYNLLS